MKKNSGTDTDKDGLVDWEEVDVEAIREIKPETNEKTYLLMKDMPTIDQCAKYYHEKYFYVPSGLVNMAEERGKSGNDGSETPLEFVLREAGSLQITPIISNPGSVDSDGDEIEDSIDIEKLRENYIENMFELSPLNHPLNPIYIKINKNNVEIIAHIKFTGKANELFPESEKTYAEVIVEGIRNLWGIDVVGNEFDFVPGLKGSVSVDIIYETPGNPHVGLPNQEYMYITVEERKDSLWDQIQHILPFSSHGVPHTNNTKIFWSITNGQTITMYPNYIGYNDYDLYGYQETVSHEFGHCLGLADGYPSANGGLKLKNNEEFIVESETRESCIMFYNQKVYSNDIEMVLYAFSENKWQYYFDKGIIVKRSKAIKCEQEFEDETTG